MLETKWYCDRIFWSNSENKQIYYCRLNLTSEWRHTINSSRTIVSPRCIIIVTIINNMYLFSKCNVEVVIVTCSSVFCEKWTVDSELFVELFPLVCHGMRVGVGVEPPMSSWGSRLYSIVLHHFKATVRPANFPSCLVTTTIFCYSVTRSHRTGLAAC